MQESTLIDLSSDKRVSPATDVSLQRRVGPVGRGRSSQHSPIPKFEIGMIYSSSLQRVMPRIRLRISPDLPSYQLVNRQSPILLSPLGPSFSRVMLLSFQRTRNDRDMFHRLPLKNLLRVELVAIVKPLLDLLRVNVPQSTFAFIGIILSIHSYSTSMPLRSFPWCQLDPWPHE